MWFLAAFTAALITPTDLKPSSPKNNSSRQEVFSFAPNNTPVARVYIYGRPIYVRQPFVIPQRDFLEKPRRPAIAEEKILKHELKRLISSPDLFSKRKFRNDFSLPPFFNDWDHDFPRPKYPLPQCYTNDSGFMCCNPRLEWLMKETYDDLDMDPKWQSCNIEKLVEKIQENAHEAFDLNFETIVGYGDFATKVHFYKDYICKIERGEKFIIAYASPSQPHPEKEPYIIPDAYPTAYQTPYRG
ncbi:unnamed protein product [Caenorhabditis auriculariae]|uniref:Ground-like domain-containing protein n=1 Tax=Caenorhabditis auriculariae TaxID=2777116 RepID=A0A8S1HKT3_9PELO|nr:unnamed protein product [Caenorhabditis auriculariae]